MEGCLRSWFGSPIQRTFCLPPRLNMAPRQTTCNTACLHHNPPPPHFTIAYLLPGYLLPAAQASSYFAFSTTIIWTGMPLQHISRMPLPLRSYVYLDMFAAHHTARYRCHAVSQRLSNIYTLRCHFTAHFTITRTYATHTTHYTPFCCPLHITRTLHLPFPHHTTLATVHLSSPTP